MDGVSLILRLARKEDGITQRDIRPGWSNASRYRRAAKGSSGRG
jgi:hypothetical protein